MYRIDLSFLSRSAEVIDDLEKIESKSNSLYQSILVDHLSFQNRNFSGCFACGADLTNQTPPDERRIIEAECKGLLGFHYCELAADFNGELSKGDLVIVNCDDSVEIAKVVEMGDIVKYKRRKFGFYAEELPTALRKVNENDMEQYRKNLNEEIKARPFFKKSVENLNLNMKLIDIHYQFDRKKLFFFYTSDGRVDFRELAKQLAAEFRTRIELRQIGVRDEAKRIGGLGSCGREYCCSSFINNFKRITTQCANDQNLSANLSKLSGPCGKLKCCLSFELDEY